MVCAFGIIVVFLDCASGIQTKENVITKIFWDSDKTFFLTTVEEV